MKRSAIFFDFDGVLIDSLPAHLQICRDKALEYKLPISIPAVADFRERIRNGTRISPMLCFFTALGFPPALAERAVQDYDRDFAQIYRPPLFPRCRDVLEALRSDGWTLGIVTSNTADNLRLGLGTCFELFDPRCIFTLDRFAEPRSKARSLEDGARALGLAPQTCIYVGDLPSDAAAAEAAGFRFLGVTYGWGIGPGDSAYDTVDRISDIPAHVTAKVLT